LNVGKMINQNFLNTLVEFLINDNLILENQ